jgi:serine/threonine protein kinase
VTLIPGARLGPYQVVSLIGAGGMGEVYRARDTKLNRDVALKILPELFAIDPDRLARFKREAQLLASLNHPNIAGIHGFEDTGAVHGLVLELVEGPTLADRIAQGPIPPDEALPVARQLAEALEAAHEQGVIHRDLKPANIKVRPDGMVKVLDFGLAKAFEAEPAAVSGGLSMSPTITSPAATRVGTILGTAAYMSPEQARGKTVDKRSDIWAFGCVVYEMLTGRRAFGGDEVTDTLAFVITKEPDWAALPASAPSPLHRLLRRCLEKDSKRRLRDIGEARIELEKTAAAVGEQRRILVKTIGGTEPERLLYTGKRHLHLSSWSSDGRWIAFYEFHPRSVDAWLLDVNEPSKLVPVATTPANEWDPVFSPDGRWLAYSSDETGRYEVYVVSVPDLGAKQQVSRDGGFWPEWSVTGRDLYFFDRFTLSPGTMMATTRATNAGAVAWQQPRALFKVPRVSDSTMARDGQSVYFIAPNPDAPAREINVVVNWLQEALIEGPSGIDRR